MIIKYLQLTLAAFLPGIVALILFYMNKKGVFRNIPDHTRTICLGIIFGIIAICGTEFGIPMNGAQINCRDAAVLIGGLIFGGPVGLIAGLIGGAERWIAVAWGVASYTRVACTVATICAGVFSAIVNRFMLERKRPTVGMAMFIAVSVEVFHLMMVFFTNMSDVANAIKVIRSCTIPMVLTNGISVILAVLLVSVVSNDNYLFLFKKKSETPVFETIQRGLTIIVVISLIFTCFFVYKLESNVSTRDAKILLKNAVDDAAAELEEEVNLYMIEECQSILEDLDNGETNLEKIAKEYSVQEIIIADKNGIVTDSNKPNFKGYDLSDNEQSSEFLCLLKDKSEYVQKYGTVSKSRNIERKIAGIKTKTGILEIAYDAEGIYDIISSKIISLADNRHVGNSGYIVITDEDGNIVSASSGFVASTFKKWLLSQKTVQEKTKIVTIKKEEYFYRSVDAEGYKICAIYPFSEASIQRDIMIYLTIFLIVLVFMAVYIMLYMIIKTIVVDEIIKMANSLSMISDGNLNEVVDVNSNEEFASLSHDINRTVDTLKHYIDEAAARIDAELELAAKIQISVLPNPESSFFRRKEFDIFAKMDPAKEVGGDFYDFYHTAENEINIMIADVSGKGIPAAMFMMRAKSILKDFTEKGIAVNESFTRANNSLCNGNDAEMFVTAWQAKIYLDTGKVEFANAGHNPPLVKHKDCPFSYLKQKKNLVLAAMEGISYRLNEIWLEPGDILFLYTDGVVEATDSNEQLYGEERLLNILNSQTFTSMKEMLKTVREDVDLFVGDAPQFDDLTMLAIKYNGWGIESLRNRIEMLKLDRV